MSGQNGNGRKPPAMALQTLETVRARLHERRRVLGNWEAVASEFGLSLGTCVRVANGYDPRTAAIRAKLRLPALAPAPVCPRCQIPHVRKTCPPPPRDTDFDAWKVRNAGKLAEYVAWAETPKAERVWPLVRRQPK